MKNILFFLITIALLTKAKTVKGRILLIKLDEARNTGLDIRDGPGIFKYLLRQKLVILRYLK